MNLYKKMFSIKYENILAIIFLPFILISISKSSISMLFLSIAMNLTLYLGLYYSVRIARKEALLEAKKGIYDPLIDLIELNNYIKQITKRLTEYKKAIKKEVKNTQYTNRQTYILKKSF